MYINIVFGKIECVLLIRCGVFILESPDCPSLSPRHCLGVEKGFQSGAGTSREDRDDGEE